MEKISICIQFTFLKEQHVSRLRFFFFPHEYV